MSRYTLYLCRGYRNGQTIPLLLQCAEDFLNIERGSLDASCVLRTGYGKPFFSGLPVEVSVSHTGSLFAVLITGRENGPVGLDVQAVRSADYGGLAGRFFTPQEQQYVEENGEDGFFCIWTRKEALTKYLGLPLAKTLRRHSVVSDGRPAEQVEDAQLFHIDLGSGICAAAAVQASNKVNLCRKEMNEEQS